MTADRLFTKPRRPGDDPRGEAAGLRWLAAAPGGVRIPRVVDVDDDRLVLESIDEVVPSATATRAFGAALARTHAAAADWWGCPPDGWPGTPAMGRSRTPLVLDSGAAPPTWGAFYADHRVEVFARRLHADGIVDANEARVFDRLCERLREGALDHPQPALLVAAGHPVARVHGDMWAGNVLYDGGPTGAALIDPLAHGGHAETDLATLTVFGFPHLAEVYAGYDEASELADGWRERVELHQLAIVIMHAHLFRGGYTRAALRIADRYL